MTYVTPRTGPRWWPLPSNDTVRIDILVNNAGVAFSAPAEEDIERFKSLTENVRPTLRAPWLLIEMCARSLVTDESAECSTRAAIDRLNSKSSGRRDSAWKHYGTRHSSG